MNKFTPTAIELFAGAGGLMLGLEDSGFKTLLANEVHPDPCKTLSCNFPEVPVICGSIKDYNAKSLLKSAGIDNKSAKRLTLLAGGPPCQGYSTAGMKDPNDPRNTLIGDFIRMVKELSPSFFLMENVPGLKTLHQGRIFDNVMNEFDTLGYTYTYKIVFAADYGVPQMRKRLIIIGSRDSVAPPFPEPTHKNPASDDLFHMSLPDYIGCGEAIGDLPELNSGETTHEYDRPPNTDFQRKMRRGSIQLHNHQASKHRKTTADYYGLIPPGGTNLDIPKHLRNGKQGIQRWPVNGLSRTITTEPTDFLHPTLNRIPTVRETARIQTFPDKYQFLGQRTTGNKMRRLGYCSQTQQVGNAVPPLLGQALGNAILSFIGEHSVKLAERRKWKVSA